MKRAVDHVRLLELLAALAARSKSVAIFFGFEPSASGAFAGYVVLALRGEGDHRREHERDGQGQIRRKSLSVHSKHSEEGRDGNSGTSKHGAEADRVNLVQVRPFELDIRRAHLQEWFIYHEVRDDGPDPGYRDVRVETEHEVEETEDPN